MEQKLPKADPDPKALTRYDVLERKVGQQERVWLGNFRRLVVRYERYALNLLGFVHLGCILILLRQGW